MTNSPTKQDVASDAAIAQAYKEAVDGKIVHTNMVGLFRLIGLRAREIESTRTPASARDAQGGEDWIEPAMRSALRDMAELQYRSEVHPENRGIGLLNNLQLCNWLGRAVAEHTEKLCDIVEGKTPPSQPAPTTPQPAGDAAVLMKCICTGEGSGCTNRCDRGQLPPIPAETITIRTARAIQAGKGDQLGVAVRSLRKLLELIGRSSLICDRVFTDMLETNVVALEAALAGSQEEVVGASLLRKPGPLPSGCYCKPGKCMAPRVMGRQTQCRDPDKAAGDAATTPDPAAPDGDGCGACGGDQAAQCGATGCRLTEDSPDADGLPEPWALYVGTHEDEHGKVTAMVEVFGERDGLKLPLFTADQMRAFAALTSQRQSEDETIDCEVAVAPASTFGVGVKLSTVISAIRLRKETEGTFGFTNKLRAAIATPPAAIPDMVVDGELERLRTLLNTPELHDFAKGAVLEAAHQRERWGNDHDAGKEPADWFWLLGYLAGKALKAHNDGNTEKALHHTISSAAALANWHGAILGTTNMRPGIDGEAALAAAPGSAEGVGP